MEKMFLSNSNIFQIILIIIELNWSNLAFPVFVCLIFCLLYNLAMTLINVAQENKTFKEKEQLSKRERNLKNRMSSGAGNFTPLERERLKSILHGCVYDIDKANYKIKASHKKIKQYASSTIITLAAIFIVLFGNYNEVKAGIQEIYVHTSTCVIMEADTRM
ncbi:MAG: hypothetical protein Q4C61_11385 [Lachnospiraceae bacterium]|nr:hypothetical protein [Lachnospiraceae bacterium]